MANVDDTQFLSLVLVLNGDMDGAATTVTSAIIEAGCAAVGYTCAQGSVVKYPEAEVGYRLIKN
uniref:Uncharacterized protein n=1 Tax=viral metagenome TaxID=1070528 RepID=A0A6M3JI24_9ZZZZ